MNKILVVFFLMLYSCMVYPQNNTIDSLQKVLRTQKEDTNKVNTLIEINWAFLYNRGYDSLLQYANTTLSLSQKINFTKGCAYAYNFIGGAYYKQNNYAEALKNFYKSLSLFEKIDDQASVGYTLVGIGHNYRYLNNYSEALKNYFAAVEDKKKKLINKKIKLKKLLLS
jgi:two-component system sensor histidine kinase/response regulator